MASNSLLSSIEHARDFRYFGNKNYPFFLIGNKNYPVRPTKATISQTPVVGGKLIKFNLSLVTDQVILGAELVSDLSLSGDHVDSQKMNLAASCPISVGDFELNFCQVLPVDVTPGNYSLKMTLDNQDGRQLSCFAFDYTIPFDRTIRYPVID